jgi:hypothetical protein
MFINKTDIEYICMLDVWIICFFYFGTIIEKIRNIIIAIAAIYDIKYMFKFWIIVSEFIDIARQ